MKGLIGTFRLAIVGFAALLSIAGFYINKAPIPLLVPIFIMVFGSATMAQNDWRDRFHDVKKSKIFAKENPGKFAATMVFMWVTAACLAITLYKTDTWFGLLSFICIVLGLAYSEVRKVPLLSGIVVAVTASIPVLYSASWPLTWASSCLGLAVLFFIWGREILKDVEDLAIDVGYKATLPTLVGSKTSKVAVAVLYLLTLVFIVQVSPYALLMAPPLIAIALTLIGNGNYKSAQRYTDVAMVLALIVLCIPT